MSAQASPRSSPGPEDEATLFSTHFGLGKTQAELDFVDVPVDRDIPLFVDPYAISRRPDPWSRDAHLTVYHFFDSVVQAIRRGDEDQARSLLLQLREPNETRFGYSQGRPRGAGIGQGQARQLYNALSESSAVKTGFLNSLEEAELMVEGISFDKISDLTTNVIRGHLSTYTAEQCELHGIPTQQVALPPFYDRHEGGWRSEYHRLPVVDRKPVLLVPKVIARQRTAYDHTHYYRDFVVEFLQAEHLNVGSSLVRTFKNGRQVVTKKSIEAIFPGTKENLFRFSRDHPEVLQEYREELEKIEQRKTSEVDPYEQATIARALIRALGSIPAGSASANDYHELMVGVVEFLFFPLLLFPRKEQEIHLGRKRIDIVMENGARDGVLFRLHEVRKLPCSYVVLECKNYRTDVGNPELDQLSSRFSTNRGKLGFMLCRQFEDRALFVERCRDTFKDDRGLILPVDDETVCRWLEVIATQGRGAIDGEIRRAIDEVWLS